MILVSFLVGFLTSVWVFVASLFGIGNFSLRSGISPLILAMVTFFSLTFGSYIYIWAARVVFPTIYSRSRAFFIHITVFMIILFVVMLPVYMIVWRMSVETATILLPYLIHILLAIFGIEIIISLISQYRYTLLSFYSNLFSIVTTGSLVFYIYSTTSNSKNALFILMGLSILGFVLSTVIIFAIKSFYYQYYKVTGNDPIGDMFLGFQQEDEEKIRSAQKTLLTKK